MHQYQYKEICSYELLILWHYYCDDTMVMLLWVMLHSALKKLNEKKQVFNMYKTQKQKEEKVYHYQSCDQVYQYTL